jgi:hypothetical protein
MYKSVCFTETPLEHIGLLTEHLDDREIQFKPYGIVITKAVARKAGVNPIMYADITPGHNWDITLALDKIIVDALNSGSPANHPIFKITPFIEQMGTGTDRHRKPYKKEFWWEREWRNVGDFVLPPRYIVVCPVNDIEVFQKLTSGLYKHRIACIAPTWSMEQIIAFLAGFDLQKDVNML